MLATIIVSLFAAVATVTAARGVASLPKVYVSLLFV